jgi:prevent-host-death family protein
MRASIHEAKTHLSRLIQKAVDGEEVIISKRDRPLVRLVPIQNSNHPIRFGALADVVLAMDDTFDDELEDFALKYFSI